MYFLSRETLQVSGRYSAFLGLPLIKVVFEVVVVRYTKIKNLISECLSAISESSTLNTDVVVTLVL